MAAQYAYPPPPPPGYTPSGQYVAVPPPQQVPPGSVMMSPSQPVMVMQSPPPPVVLAQPQPPEVEPRFNPCLCCNIISSPATSLRSGAILAGLTHFVNVKFLGTPSTENYELCFTQVHAIVALVLWVLHISARYDITYTKHTPESRDDNRINGKNASSILKS